MKYNWQHAQWPKFVYKADDFDELVQRYQKKAYSLLGRIEQLNIGDKQEAHILLMVEEAISSSQIEGEQLNREDVRSSVARFLGLKIDQKALPCLKEEGIAALLIDVRESLKQALSEKKLCYWHKLLLQDNDNSRRAISKGKYRDEKVDIIKDDLYGNIDVVYQAPGATRAEVREQMALFLTWYNDTAPTLDTSADASRILSGPVRAAIAHLWFVAIHPFEDGNGRIGRAIAEHALYQDFENPPLFSLSTTINANRKQYYAQLQATNGTIDISDWISWFVSTVYESQVSAIAKVDFILQKAKFWDAHRATKLSERQHKVLTSMFSSGYDGLIEKGLSNEKYRAITGCSLATATRDLNDLIDKNILYIEGSGRRNLRYLINFSEQTVFKTQNPKSKKGSRDDFIGKTLDKLLHNIKRNLDFHQDSSNAKLIDMLDHYKQLAGDDEEALNKLNALIAKDEN